MMTRIASERTIARQSALAAGIAAARDAIASGKAIARASDDPAAAARIATLRRAGADAASAIASADGATATAQLAATTLSSIDDMLDRAREVATLAASGTASAADRATYAAELRGMASDVASLVATHVPGGGALFADGPALQVPIGDTLVSPAPSRNAFTITTAAGPRDLPALLGQAADAIGQPPTIDAIAAAVAQLADTRALHGLTAARIDSLRERVDAARVDALAARDTIESIDVAATAMRLQRDQLTLDAVQAAFARTTRRTLFDLLG